MGGLRHPLPQSHSLAESARMCFLLALDPKAIVLAEHQGWTRPHSTGGFMATEVLGSTQSCPSAALVQEGQSHFQAQLGELTRVGFHTETSAKSKGWPWQRPVTHSMASVKASSDTSTRDPNAGSPQSGT